MAQEFGGDWTEKKLDRLNKYLSEYTKIFKNSPKTAYFNIIYLDAFAGSGSRDARKKIKHQLPRRGLFGLIKHEPAPAKKGSAAIALEISPPFDNYIFIDKKTENIEALQELLKSHPDKKSKTKIIKAEANAYLKEWCKTTNWRKNRAVVFLDPYGMQVEWKTLVAIANTKAIDLWILFPVGQGVNRLLTRKKPGALWAKRLTLVLGTSEWETVFYEQLETNGLFGSTVIERKIATFNSIEKFFVDRLETIFSKVSRKPLELRNSKNVPIYSLCFAASNPKGADIAVRIADYLLRH